MRVLLASAILALGLGLAGCLGDGDGDAVYKAGVLGESDCGDSYPDKLVGACASECGCTLDCIQTCGLKAAFIENAIKEYVATSTEIARGYSCTESSMICNMREPAPEFCDENGNVKGCTKAASTK